MRPLVARFGVLALVAAVACQAAQGPGPSPSSSGSAASGSATPAPTPTQSYPSREGTCAMRVSESFTLANDLTCTGDGMVVVSDNITVDLGGHTLTGPGMGPQTWPLPQLDSVGVGSVLPGLCLPQGRRTGRAGRRRKHCQPSDLLTSGNCHQARCLGIDVAVSLDVAWRNIADSLADALVEPLAPGGWLGRCWTRAFLGARVEVVGGVNPELDRPEPTDFGPHAAGRLELVGWRGLELHVPPLELQLRAAERRGLDDRARLIRQALA